MTCYHPMSGYRKADGSGKITMDVTEAFFDRPVRIACGQCYGCRLERSRQWAVRCLHEAQMHDTNAFVTLTYDDQALPEDGSLKLEHWQKFARRVRKQVGKFRFFHCGEYTDDERRPHYHALMFGLDFHEDRTTFKKNDRGEQLWRSPTLEKLWPHGYSSIGAVTFESASYVARYCMKKVNGERAAEHYESVNRTTGEVTQLRPEYTTMSRRPGIGQGWIDAFSGDVYPTDFVVVRGKQARPPRYYDDRYGASHPEQLEEIKSQRQKKGRIHAADATQERLKIREAHAKAKGKLAKTRNTK